MKNISIIGSGNVGAHIAVALKKNSYNIFQVYSREIEKARSLAKIVDAKHTNKIEEIEKVDLIILAVPETAINKIILNFKSQDIVHTSGSVDINIFKNKFTNYGVLYPLQTFNKGIEINILDTPILIEANNNKFEKKIKLIAEDISNNVTVVDSKKREIIHLAAVFACNFTNQMFVIADNILKKSDLQFSILLPLIKQTVKKIENNEPGKVHTGPAIRKDINTIKKHIKQIEDREIKLIYKKISENIINSNA